MEHDLGIVQREKLVDVVPPIEEFDPSARDCDVLFRHARTLSRDRPGHQSAVLLLACLEAGVRREARATTGMNEIAVVREH